MGVFEDALFQKYQEEVNNLRNGLLGNGPTTNLNSPQDLATELYYAKTKVLGAAFIGLETVQANKSDKETEQFYKNATSLGNTNVSAETVQVNTGEENTKTYYDNLTTYGQALVDGSQVVPSENPETGATQFTVTTPQPAITQPEDVQAFIATNTAAAPDVEKYFRSHNTNAAQPRGGQHDGILPTPGEDVKTQDGSYGQAISNSLKFTLPDGKGGTKSYFKSWVLPNGQPDPSSHGTPNEPFTDKVDAMLEQKRRQSPGSYKFFIEKLHGKSIDGTFYKKGPIKPGLKRTDLPNRMIFPAYIQKFNDSYQLGWSDYKFIGRGEKVYVYEETTRTLQLEFYMMSDFSADLLVKAVDDYKALTTDASATPTRGGNLDSTAPNLQNSSDAPRPANTDDPSQSHANDLEIMQDLQRIWPDWGTGTTPDPSLTRGTRTGFVQGIYSGTPEMLWSRMTFLAQCCYAWYRKDGKMKEQPFVRVRIGDFFDVVAKIDNINFTQDEFDMDLNPSVVGNIPMGTMVTMSLTIIHEDEPTSEYPRFYHRADFDTPDTANQVPDSLSEVSDNMDSTLDKNKSNSPIAAISRLSEQGREKMSFPKDMKAVQGTLNNFKGSLGGLQGFNSSSLSLASLEKVKDLLSNAKRLTDISKKLDVEKLKDTKKSVEFDKIKERTGGGSDITPAATSGLSDSMANSPLTDNVQPGSSQLPDGGKPPSVTTMKPGMPDYNQSAGNAKKLFPQYGNPSIMPPTNP